MAANLNECSTVLDHTRFLGLFQTTHEIDGLSTVTTEIVCIDGTVLSNYTAEQWRNKWHRRSVVTHASDRRLKLIQCGIDLGGVKSKWNLQFGAFHSFG